jgi:hypothetical protein
MSVEIIETDYGYRCIAIEPLNVADSTAAVKMIKSIVQRRKSFSQIIEVHGKNHFNIAPEILDIIEEQQRHVLSNGLRRSAVLVPNRKTIIKIIQVSFKTGMYEWERYIEMTDPDHEKLALDWIQKGIDPDDRTI